MPSPKGRSIICAAMSVQPLAFASAVSSASLSQSRFGVWAKVAAGVAWVRRALLTTPVARPMASDSSSRVATPLPFAEAQSL